MFSLILNKNKKFKDLYKGQECYIIGNGASIKFYDLKKFSNKKALVCGWIYLHKDFKYLDVALDCEIHPFIFYKYWKNNYRKIIEKNKIRDLYFETGRISNRYSFFTSLTNYFSLRKFKNVYYLHHGGKKEPDQNYLNPCKKYSLMKGSYYCLIGLAKFMGFEKIYLVGMDYLLENPITGHFYEKESFITKLDEFKKKNDEKFFSFFKSKNSIKIIKIKNSNSSILTGIDYEDFFKTKENYKPNTEIVDIENLERLNNLNINYKIF